MTDFSQAARPEIDRIARELSELHVAADADSSPSPRLYRWLRILVTRGGSDLLLVPGAPACISVKGEVQKIESDPLDGPEIEAAVVPALSSHALHLYRESQISDSSYRIPELGRFRINLHRERGRAAAAIRALPTRVPSLKEDRKSTRL